MGDPDPRILVVGIGLCLLILAFTSAVDAAFTNISRHRLNALIAEGVARARALTRLMDDPYRFKATIILLNTGTIIAATAFLLTLTYQLSVWAQAGSLVLLLLVILVFSEAIPKLLAVRNPEVTAAMLVRPMMLASRLFWPLVALINLGLHPLNKLIHPASSAPSTLVTEEEIRMMVNMGEEEGLIEHDEREMIESIFSFADTLVREIMVPRVDIIALDVETTFEKALETVINQGHSRIPVYDDTIDNIVGILYAKDLLPELRDGRQDTPIRSLMREVYFVPETKKVGALFEDMQKRKVHITIVVDEYGVTAGLATIEDVIEEIVGEIQDEFDAEEPSVQVVSETEAIVDARVPISDINDLTGVDLQSTDAERIGGLVSELLERVPRVGDEVVIDGVAITVLSVKGGVRPHKLRLIYPRALELEFTAAQQ